MMSTMLRQKTRWEDQDGYSGFFGANKKRERRRQRTRKKKILVDLNIGSKSYIHTFPLNVKVRTHILFRQIMTSLRFPPDVGDQISECLSLCKYIEENGSTRPYSGLSKCNGFAESTSWFSESLCQECTDASNEWSHCCIAYHCNEKPWCGTCNLCEGHCCCDDYDSPYSDEYYRCHGCNCPSSPKCYC